MVCNVLVEREMTIARQYIPKSILTILGLLNFL